MRIGKRRVLGGVLACLAGAGAHADVVAYNSIGSNSGYELIADFGTRYEPDSYTELAGGAENDARVGDIVTLAGAGRDITRFDVRFTRGSDVTPNFNVSATLTLYTLLAGIPDQVLWSGQVSGQFPAFNKLLTLSYAPGVTVPATFAFAIGIDAFTNSSTSSFGVGFSTVAPIVGSSPAYVILQDSTSLNWYQEVPAVKNMDAQIWTIPGPAGAASLGLGMLGMSRRRR